MRNPRLLAVDPRLGPVAYRDRKRWLWALSVVYPLIPFAGIGLHAWTGQPAWLLLPLAIGYVGGPLLDAWLGEDEKQPAGSRGAAAGGRPLLPLALLRWCRCTS